MKSLKSLKSLKRKCRSCKQRSVDNYGRCRTPDCKLELKKQFANISFGKSLFRVKYGKGRN